MDLAPSALSPPPPAGLRLAGHAGKRRLQLSPVKPGRRSLLPGEVREELAGVSVGGGGGGSGVGSGKVKGWSRVGVAVHTASVLKQAGAGFGSPMRGRGDNGSLAGKSTVYVAENYKE